VEYKKTQNLNPEEGESNEREEENEKKNEENVTSMNLQTTILWNFVRGTKVERGKAQGKKRGGAIGDVRKSRTSILSPAFVKAERKERGKRMNCERKKREGTNEGSSFMQQKEGSAAVKNINQSSGGKVKGSSFVCQPVQKTTEKGTVNLNNLGLRRDKSRLLNLITNNGRKRKRT